MRGHPTHFVVVRGHWSPSVERIVRETDRYQVVETFGDAALLAARSADSHPT